ncbi:MAG: xylS [Paenibacillus sp.]|nr:xylS [Paenibacillus sp.]
MTAPDREDRSVLEFQLAAGAWMRIQPVTPHSFRVRLGRSRSFAEPASIRDGMIRPPAPRCEFAVKHAEHRLAVQSAHSGLDIDTRDGCFRFVGTRGRQLLETVTTPRIAEPAGFSIAFSLQAGEALYGSGSGSDEHLQLRGLSLETGWDAASPNRPVPYVMSAQGWAIMAASMQIQRFDLGHTCNDRLVISSEDGELDLYLFSGAGFGDLLDQYTTVVGKPALLPIWAYGLSFVVNPNTNARDVMNDALKFREANVPCDLIVLNAGWSEKPDDGALNHRWHPERFPPSNDTLNQSMSFVDTLRRHGFKLSLRLCCDTEKLQDIAESGQSPYRHWERFTADGVSAFQIVEEMQQNTAQQAAREDGLSERAARHVHPALLAKPFFDGFRRQTDQRPFLVYTTTDYTGLQPFAAILSSESFENPRHALAAQLRYGLCGHANIAVPMNLSTREGIHAGFLQPWTQVNKWPSQWHPCLLEEPLRELFRTYAQLRYRLLPYFYSAAHVSARTGFPIMRAMPLMFPADPNCEDASGQYMLGDYLLVAVYGERVYLPEGNWFDYWTGEAYSGAQTVDYSIPEGGGGPLFIRAGAILPYWPVMEHIDLNPAKTTCVELHLFPHHASEFTLVEDDGVSFQYEEGRITQTSIRCEMNMDGRIFVEIAPRAGTYEGMPEKRAYELVIRTDGKPDEVTVDGAALPERADRRARPDSSTGWRYYRREKTVRLRVEESSRGESVRIELYCPRAAQRDGELLFPAAGGHFPGAVRADSAAASLHLLTGVQAALIRGDADAMEAALDRWWADITDKSALPGTWRVQVLRAATMAIRHAERHGGSGEAVFGRELDDLFMLRGIVSPAQGRELLLRLFRHSLRQAEQPAEPALHPLVHATIAIVKRNLSRKLTLHEIAGKLDVAPSHLSRLFSKTGQSYSDYALKTRMERAKELLGTGKKVHEAASMTGFKDAAHFSRSFSKYWGKPPISFK